MKIIDFFIKVRRVMWLRTVSKLRYRSVYPFLYRSYWHMLLCPKPEANHSVTNYYTAVPNKGAGIGHQLANWIAGYWYAKQLGLLFAHTSFPSPKWEQLLGLGENEPVAEELIKQKAYKRVLLPLFNELRSGEVERNKRIIQSYGNRKVVFVAEQDQYYKDQYGVMEALKQKFYQSKERINDKITYSKDYYNIAIHVRRGDIVVAEDNRNQNLAMRWQNNDYFINVLKGVVQHIKPQKPVAIYLFSQGKVEDFADFGDFANLHFCLDMAADDSFLHMVYADLLITSKSSFSYKPALISKGVKICPEGFWHGYPKAADWLVANEDGVFDITSLNRIITDK